MKKKTIWSLVLALALTVTAIGTATSAFAATSVPMEPVTKIATENEDAIWDQIEAVEEKSDAIFQRNEALWDKVDEACNALPDDYDFENFDEAAFVRGMTALTEAEKETLLNDIKELNELDAQMEKLYGQLPACDNMPLYEKALEKADPKVLDEIDTLVINGAECEPYLNGDHLTMKNHPEELLKGIELARIASGLDKAYYGIEKNKQDAIDLLLSKNPAQYGVEIVPENVKYPQGAEKMQIKAITNREVKPGGLPSGVGCNVISTQTAYAIYRACYEGMPSIERVLTVAGSAMGDKSYNLQCRFGTPFSYIVEQCGGFVVEPKKIVLGGPMMGLIATNLEAPNIKGTAGILFFTDKEDRSVENPTCIHCGKCLTVCPMKLEPLYMYKYYQKRDFENMQKYHILDCFECGSCSYNCPGRLPLTHTFKTAKLLFAARAAEEKARAEAAAKEAETK